MGRQEIIERDKQIYRNHGITGLMGYLPVGDTWRDGLYAYQIMEEVERERHPIRSFFSNILKEIVATIP